MFYIKPGPSITKLDFVNLYTYSNDYEYEININNQKYICNIIDIFYIVKNSQIYLTLIIVTNDCGLYIVIENRMLYMATVNKGINTKYLKIETNIIFDKLEIDIFYEPLTHYQKNDIVITNFSLVDICNCIIDINKFLQIK